MLPNVTQSYKDQTWKVVGLKLCSDCLSLSLILLYESMQPFERDRQELCVIQKTRQATVTLLKKSKCWQIENCGPRSVFAKTSIYSPCLLRASARRKI